MTPPRFLSLEQVYYLHDKSLEKYGGQAGVRDPGLIESAISQPRNVFHYSNGDLFDLAAAYAFHIAEAQAFFDGNKRTALASAISFLVGHGVPANTFPTEALYDAMIAIAEKRMDKPALAALLRSFADSE